MTKMGFDALIRKRHSVRKFNDKKPSWRKIIDCIEAANQAPLAGNIPCFKYIIVSDPEKIAELSEASQQPFFAHAHYVVAVCSVKKDIELNYDERSERYIKQQAGAAIEHFLLKITELGLGSCWVGAYSDKIVKRILAIPDHLAVDVEALLPVGYETGKAGKPKPKPELENCLFFNKWNNNKMNFETTL